MASASEDPPQPPPHGEHQQRPPRSGLPDGNYDIFIIPPHSAGGGFIYLPSLQPHMNSFLAGCACTFVAVYVYSTFTPLVRYWVNLTSGHGSGFVTAALMVAVGVGAWAFGKTQAENRAGPLPTGGGGGASGGASSSSQQSHDRSSDPPPRTQQSPPRPPPQPSPQQSPPPRPSPAASGWEKAREETRKREEERKRADELKKKRDEAQKLREEAERKAKAKAEIEKWEQARAREKEQREREARERIARERSEREKAAGSTRSSPTKPTAYEKPTARSQAGTEDAYSYRPYDTPKKPTTPKASIFNSSASSISGVSESSYAPSQSTARTTPPPSHRGPYTTKDPDKIMIKAVYRFSDKSPLRPLSQLIAGQGPVTDGLILKIKTEGLFIDDDVRDVPQREWDVKAWALKLVEDGRASNGLHLFRATERDIDNKKYFFVLDESESWKVAAGVARIRKGSLSRSLNFNTIKETEVKAVLGSLGW